MRIRGTAHQIFERYVALAQEEAATSGDRVAAENLYQHAEHYFRLDNADRDSNPSDARPTTPAEVEVGDREQGTGETDMERSQSGWGDDRPGFL